MMEYHIIPSTLCHDTVSHYKTIKSDVSDGLENHLTGWGQRVKGSFVPKHSLKCNSSATSPQRHLNQSGRKHTRIKEQNKMYSTIQSYLSRPRKKKNLYAIYNEVIHKTYSNHNISCYLRARTRRTKCHLCCKHNEIKKRWHDFIWKTQCCRDNHVGNHTLKTDCTECIM